MDVSLQQISVAIIRSEF